MGNRPHRDEGEGEAGFPGLSSTRSEAADESDTGICRHVGSVAVSPDGKWLAAAAAAHRPGVPGEVKVYRLSTSGHSLSLVLVLKGHKRGVSSITFSPCGRDLATGGYDGTVRIWDVPSLVSMFADHQKAGLGQDGIDTLLARQARTLAGHRDGVTDVAYSSDGKLLAFASGDSTIGIWDPATGRQVRVLRGHNKGVHSVAFSPDGKQIASSGGSLPAETKVWDVTSGQELLTLKKRGGPVAFSHGGQRLAVGRVIFDARPLTDEIRLAREAASLYRHASQAPLLGEEIARRALYRESTGVDRYEPLTPLFPEDVVERIRRDGTVSDAVRQQALRMAEHFRTDHRRLRQASWAVLRRSGLTAEDYREAIPWVEEACREHPEEGESLVKLGVAQYRAGKYQQALATLERVYKLIPAKDESEEYGKLIQTPDGKFKRATDDKTDPDDEVYWSIPELPAGMDLWVIPADLALLAMTKHQLGQHEQARAHLQELRDFLKNFQDYWEQSLGLEEDPRPLAREAETLIQGQPSKPESRNSKSPANSNDQ